MGKYKNTDILKKNNSIHMFGGTKNRKICYDEMISENIIKIIDGKIMVTYDKKDYILIRWDDLKKKFTDGEIDRCFMAGINELRKNIVHNLLEDAEFIKDCYQEFGSTNLISDLDFTYITYNQPNIVMDKLIKFYNIFEKIFGGTPDIIFDTNYYVCNTCISKECFSHISSEYIRKLFVLKENYYFLYNYEKEQNKYLDKKICFYIINESYNLLKNDIPIKNKFERLLKYGNFFYSYLSKNTEYSNDIKLLVLRTVYYYMCLNSNESYISDASLRIILRHDETVDELDKYLAFCDNFLFFIELYNIYKNDFIIFFDRISKYLCRMNICLKNTKYEFNHEFTELMDIADIWKKHIRGNTRLDVLNDDTHALIIQITKKYDAELLLNIFTKLYKKISNEFGKIHKVKKIINIVNNMTDQL